MPITVIHAKVDPFWLGWQHGDKMKLHCSRRQAEEYFAENLPHWGDAEITLYLNGRDDGIAGDTFRLKGRQP